MHCYYSIRICKREIKMKLQEFLSETLKEIVAGVKESQEYADSQGAKVNPQALYRGDSKTMFMIDSRTNQPFCNVEFDVAVTSTEGSVKEGGAGVFVAAIGIGAKKTSDTSSSSVSRIKFSVPIVLPIQF